MQNQRVNWVIVCPRNLTPLVIGKIHLQHHAGSNRTYQKIKKQWYWPGMFSQILIAIKTCEVCQVAKHSNHPESIGTRGLFAGRPSQVVSIDLVGLFTLTPRNNKIILVLSDHFTRWKDAIPIPYGTTETIANILDQSILVLRVAGTNTLRPRTKFRIKLMHELC